MKEVAHPLIWEWEPYGLPAMLLLNSDPAWPEAFQAWDEVLTSIPSTGLHRGRCHQWDEVCTYMTY